MIAFYTGHFGFSALHDDADRLVELVHTDHPVKLLLHPAAKSQKQGQSCVKLVFNIQDVPAFREQAQKSGLEFGAIHKADGYVFANAKDPSNNPISISSRAYRIK